MVYTPIRVRRLAKKTAGYPKNYQHYTNPGQGLSIAGAGNRRAVWKKDKRKKASNKGGLPRDSLSYTAGRIHPEKEQILKNL